MLWISSKRSQSIYTMYRFGCCPIDHCELNFYGININKNSDMLKIEKVVVKWKFPNPFYFPLTGSRHKANNCMKYCPRFPLRHTKKHRGDSLPNFHSTFNEKLMKLFFALFILFHSFLLSFSSFFFRCVLASL